MAPTPAVTPLALHPTAARSHGSNGSACSPPELTSPTMRPSIELHDGHHRARGTLILPPSPFPGSGKQAPWPPPSPKRGPGAIQGYSAPGCGFCVRSFQKLLVRGKARARLSRSVCIEETVASSHFEKWC
ncbi:hypothetical protein AB205_0134660 [Aquarana catesbeiana]|uniref:Uncharacterized protein n=1 Tax=Aquarana catesbeiana TaxID=8400 RepID=A0A2G9NBC1_AQUCT|nr:hypothetical protein AB205_0134660 [Aquarana catesbeiana]PIN88373.1 hypothetical protein AB205_0134660 [Aquarana catesbeiana]PIN88377.1 hypothetical protein AB205_0134660 [Aquarana catesbeiana]PIN88379.1 hypothetical protein AB205_0134660 [Aquarana catesbeiana]